MPNDDKSSTAARNTIEHHEGGGMTFAGPRAVDVFRAATITSGLRLYAKTGMLPNRRYTPTAMMKAARAMMEQTPDGAKTAKAIKARAYTEMADALSAWAKAEAVAIHDENETAALTDACEGMEAT